MPDGSEVGVIPIRGYPPFAGLGMGSIDRQAERPTSSPLRASLEDPDDRLAGERGPPLHQASHSHRVTARSSELLAVEARPHRERADSNVGGC